MKHFFVGRTKSVHPPSLHPPTNLCTTRKLRRIPRAIFKSIALIFHRRKSLELHIQFLRYFFVGGTSSVLDLLVFAVLVSQYDVHYLLAAFFSYMAGLLWNYILCVAWVFESKHKRILEFVMIFLIAMGGLMWTELLMWIFVEFVDVMPIIAKIIVLWIVLFWNFGMRKVYVFH
ncbi:GtrA family protein [Patescibacteria group bacterium]|nr:GtrA family protein [Patescibacteria group bacterium]